MAMAVNAPESSNHLDCCSSASEDEISTLASSPLIRSRSTSPSSTASDRCSEATRVPGIDPGLRCSAEVKAVSNQCSERQRPDTLMNQGGTLLEQPWQVNPMYVSLPSLAYAAPPIPGIFGDGGMSDPPSVKKTQALLLADHCMVPPPGLMPPPIASLLGQPASLVRNQLDNVLADKTTVIIRNIPKVYDRTMLANLLDTSGFANAYNFLYLPVDFKKRRSLGYGTVNFVSHTQAVRAMEQLASFSDWKVDNDGKKACDVTFSDAHQGLLANVEYYRNREMMHPDVPDTYKPLLFKNGVCVAFPLPTQEIKLPRNVISKCQQSRK